MNQPPSAAGPAQPGLTPQFLLIAQELGQRIGLDGHRIAQGDPVDYKGVTFALAHDGPGDPDGVIVIIHMGPLVEPFDVLVCRQMLEHNALAASARGGYFCILPGTDTAAQCIRMDMDGPLDVADRVMACIALFAHQVERAATVMDQAMQMAREQLAAGSAA